MFFGGKLWMCVLSDSEQQCDTRNLSFGGQRRESNNRRPTWRIEEFTSFLFAEDMILFTGKPNNSTKRKAEPINAVFRKVSGFSWQKYDMSLLRKELQVEGGKEGRPPFRVNIVKMFLKQSKLQIQCSALWKSKVVNGSLHRTRENISKIHVGAKIPRAKAVGNSRSKSEGGGLPVRTSGEPAESRDPACSNSAGTPQAKGWN